MTLTPSPENAREIASMILPFVDQNYGVRLDYTVESLGAVDRVIDDLRKDQAFEDLQPLLFSIGCYVGEVLVRHASARWCSTESLGMAVATSPIVLSLPDGRRCNPVGQAYRRFSSGSETLAGFYRSVAEPSGDPPPSRRRDQ
jgi:hypothetical protein